jgi:hypothetical protein
LHFLSNQRHSPSPFNVNSDEGDSTFIDPASDEQWIAQLKAAIANDLKPLYKKAREDLNSALNTDHPFDSAANRQREELVNNCLQRQTDITRIAQERFSVAVNNEKFRRRRLAEEQDNWMAAQRQERSSRHAGKRSPSQPVPSSSRQTL